MSLTTPEKSCADSPSSKRRHWIRWLVATAVVAVGLLAVLAYGTHDYVRSLNSLRRVPGTNVFVMDYYGNYHIEEIRQRGMDVAHVEDSLIETLFPDVIAGLATRTKHWYVPKTVKTVESGSHHCSTVALRSVNGDTFFGRNFDWHHDACLVLRVHDAHGVASISVLDLEYLHLNRPDLDRTSLIQRVPLLFAPYYLMDGMNRHGVAVADMSVEAQPPRDPKKPAILHSTLMRLMLDQAKTTDEAAALVHQFNVHFVDTPVHLMVADASGDFRVIEFVNGGVCVTRSKQPWLISTNHLVCDTSEAERDAACNRYLKGSEIAASLPDSFGLMDAVRTVRSMSVPGFTMWTSAYDLTSGQVRVFYKTDHPDAYRDQLELERRPAPSSWPLPQDTLANSAQPSHR